MRKKSEGSWIVVGDSRTTEDHVVQQDQQDREFLLLQYATALEIYLTQVRLMVQILTILVVVNATVVGFAISERAAAILWVGAIFPFTAIVITQLMFRVARPVMHFAVSVEERFRVPDFDMLASTFAATSIHPQFLLRIREIRKLPTEIDRLAALHSLPASSFQARGAQWIAWALVSLGVAQLLAPFLLHYVFDWHLL